jgi:hypothetical protein
MCTVWRCIGRGPGVQVSPLNPLYLFLPNGNFFCLMAFLFLFKWRVVWRVVWETYNKVRSSLTGSGARPCEEEGSNDAIRNLHA